MAWTRAIQKTTTGINAAARLPYLVLGIGGHCHEVGVPGPIKATNDTVGTADTMITGCTTLRAGALPGIMWWRTNALVPRSLDAACAPKPHRCVWRSLKVSLRH